MSIEDVHYIGTTRARENGKTAADFDTAEALELLKNASDLVQERGAKTAALVIIDGHDNIVSFHCGMRCMAIGSLPFLQAELMTANVEDEGPE